MSDNDDKIPKMKTAEPDPVTESIQGGEQASTGGGGGSLGGSTGGTVADGGVPEGYVDGGFDGVTVVQESSSGGDVSVGGSSDIGIGGTTPVEITDGPPESGATPTGVTGQGEGATIKEAKRQAFAACNQAAACGAGQEAKITGTTCWSSGGYTCVVTCECPAAGVA